MTAYALTAAVPPLASAKKLVNNSAADGAKFTPNGAIEFLRISFTPGKRYENRGFAEEVSESVSIVSAVSRFLSFLRKVTSDSAATIA